MDALYGLTGVLGIIISLVWAVINRVKKRTLKGPAIVLVFALLLFSAGLVLAPVGNDLCPPDVTAAGDPPGSGTDQDNATEPAPPAATLQVHFIDVGQGDAIYIAAPHTNILIDGGERGDTVVCYLDNLGVEALDLIVGTHPHADHIGGLINVMEAIPVIEIIDPGVSHTTVTYQDYLDTIERRGIKYTEGREGLHRDLGSGLIMQIIHPHSPSEEHLNNASIVIWLVYDQVSFILTADAKQEAEQEILRREYDLKSTVLKVAHHGSSTSTTDRFLAAVNPEVAIIMCGEDNPYGYPHRETLDKLALAKITTYRTDLLGTIIVTTDGETYQINKAPWK